MDDLYAIAAAYLAEARSICVSTGAGMSVESGLETFRGDDGLWSKVKIEEMATPQAFARDPERVWAWYRQRRAKLATIEPHEGHRVLARWAARGAALTVVTQNIDGLHHRAGSRNVLELHGRLDVARCTYCDYTTQTLDDLGPDPACPACCKRLRPGVVWFGEPLPQDALLAAFTAAQQCDVCLVIGTSGVVQPAASLVVEAKSAGARVIEINPHASEFSALATVALRAACQTALVELERRWPGPQPVESAC